MGLSSNELVQRLLLIVLAVAFGGCASLSDILRPSPDRLTEAPHFPTASAEVATVADSWREEIGHNQAVGAAHFESPDTRPEIIPTAEGDSRVLAQQALPAQPSPLDIETIEEYDPWEPFNEVAFEFNRTLDRYVIKPAAKGYNFVMPELLQQLVGNGFDNIRFIPRLVNSLLQGKFTGAGRELARFVINSTAGVGGLFDIAKKEFGIEKSREDGGQTLGVWGVTPGPYLVLPLLPPLTVRDGLGFAFDMALDPLGYVLPFFWDRAGMKIGDTLNDRSLNLELFQGFEETTVEFYTAVRNAYLQRRQRLIQE